MSILFIIFLILLGVCWFEITVNKLLNDDRYIEEFDNKVVITIPRNSIDGRISLILEKICYLTEREEMAPVDKTLSSEEVNDCTGRVLMFSYKLTHAGLKARQLKEFNIGMLGRLLLYVLWKIIVLLGIIGGLLWFIANRELWKCVVSNNEKFQCISIMFSG